MSRSVQPLPLGIPRSNAERTYAQFTRAPGLSLMAGMVFLMFAALPGGGGGVRQAGGGSG